MTEKEEIRKDKNKKENKDKLRRSEIEKYKKGMLFNNK